MSWNAMPPAARPTGTPVCDNNTLYYGTIVASASGFDIMDYVVYALPSASFGESQSKCHGLQCK